MYARLHSRRGTVGGLGTPGSQSAHGSKVPANGSTPRSRQTTARSVSNVSSASATPTGEEDEDGHLKRSTRGRNPLPPSSGPLFPPLPPKQPKPKTHTSTSSTSVSNPNAVDRADSPTNSEKADVPSTSNASLTPPPPGSESAAGQDEAEAETESRDLAAAVEIDEKPVADQVKEEAGDIDDDEIDRTPRQRTLSSSRAKRRRGEEALLLDDHLLPPELRRSGQMPSKRGHMRDGDDRSVQEEEEKADEGKETSRAKEGEKERAKSPEHPVWSDDDEVSEDQDGDGQDITRCVCQSQTVDELMIQCDQCNVWQHGACVGIWRNAEAPDEYYCELCRPELHAPLRRWVRQCGRNPRFYRHPEPDDLERLNPAHSKFPPSQSKRWTESRPKSPAFSPPPGLAKSGSGSRSHHKKDLGSPVDSSELGWRSTSTSKPPQGSKSSHPTKTKKAKDPNPIPTDDWEEKPKPHSSGRLSAKRQSSITAGHKDSVSPGRSLSPSATLHSAARRRITMNSRDATYEEEMKAAMEASRREALGLPPPTEEVPEEAVEEEEVEKEKKDTKKSKRKRDDEVSVEPAPAPAAPTTSGGGKVKHPNQYTYRPKPSSSSQPAVAVSPARRGAGTPVPSIAPPQHDHGTRRAGAIANGAIAYPTLSASSVAALSWYLPEHLSAFSDLLPGPQPIALDVRSQRTLPSLSRNHHHNQRYGPFSEKRDENGKLVLPDDPPLREPSGEAETHLEPPARIKYPAKRITVGEMRKRVRSILDYVTKIQGTDEKRLERNRTIGIVVKPLPKKPGPADQDLAEAGEINGAAEVVDGDGDVTMGSTTDDQPPASEVVPPQDQDPTSAAPTGQTDCSPTRRSSADLMEELTRDLLAFQETFAANGVVSPMPPPIAAFEPSLSIPVPDLEPEAESAAEMSEAADHLVEPREPPVAAQDEPDVSNTVEETETVTERIPEDQAVEVYREGQVDQVVSQPGDEQVDPAPSTTDTTVEPKGTVPDLAPDENSALEEQPVQQREEMIVDPVV